MKNIIIKVLLLSLGLLLNGNNGFAQNITPYCLEIKWVADNAYYNEYGNGVSNHVDEVLNEVERIFKEENDICLNIINGGAIQIYTNSTSDPYANLDDSIGPDCHPGDPKKDNKCSTSAKALYKLELNTSGVQADAVLLFSSQALSNHGIANPITCSNKSRAVGLSHHNTGRNTLSLTVQAAIMAHELIHIIRGDGLHDCGGTQDCSNCPVSSLMSCAGPNNGFKNISPADKNVIEQNLKNNNCFSCNTSSYTCPSTPSNPCSDYLEPNDNFSKASSIVPNGSLNTKSNLCLKKPDIDMFNFRHNNTDFYIAVSLKRGDTEDRYYNLTYKLSSQGELEVETTYHSGDSPPDTELYLLVKLDGIYHTFKYDDNSGSNPPLSKLRVNINDPIIVNPEGLAFTCGSGCDNDLRLKCGALNGNIYNLTISLSNLQITNNGGTTANNVDVQFSLIGAENHILGTYNVGAIAPEETKVPDLPYYYINTIPDGSYNLQAKLLYGSGEYNSCISKDQVHFGTPGGKGDLKFDLCGGIDALENGFNIYFSIKNQGEVTTPATTVDIYLSDDEVFDDADQWIRTREIPELESRAYISPQPQFNLDGLDMPEGDSYILLVIDKADKVSEIDEDNNTCSYQLNSCLGAPIKNITGGNPTNNVEATTSITAAGGNNHVTIKPSAKVNFKAGNYIDLMPGFTAEYKSRFDSFIVACEIISAPRMSNSNSEIILHNYPNPFTSETTIEYNLPSETPVTLFVSDMMGKKIATLLDNEQKSSGYNNITFDGSNFPPGIYYYTIQAGNYVKTQKMILMK